MNAPLPPEDYLDGLGTAAERAEFEAALARAETALAEILAQRRVERLLASRLRPPAERARLAASIEAALAAPAPEAAEARLRRELPLAEANFRSDREPFPTAQVLRPSAAPRRWLAPFLAAAACVALGCLAWWRMPQPGADMAGRNAVPPVGSEPVIEALAGQVTLLRAGQTVILRGTSPWRPGDALETGAGGRVRLRFGPDTSFELQPQGRLQTAAAEVRLLQGTVAARVAQQPWKLETAHAQLEVRTTAFEVRAGAEATSVLVDEGRLALRHRDDEDGSVPLGRREFAVVQPGMRLEARPWPVGGPGAPLPPPLARNVFLWPFAPVSPWNRPLGGGAQYEPIRTPGFDLASAARGRLPRPILRELPHAPATGVRVRGAVVGTVRVLPNLPFPPLPGFILTLIDPVTGQATELLQPRRLPSGEIEAEALGRGSALGLGFGPDWQPVLPSGFAAAGGVVRNGELAQGIRHALALNLPRAALNRDRPFVWPARPAPLVGPGPPGQGGNVALGSLLALPPAFDPAALGFAPGSPGHALATALRDYGAYVTDCSAPGVRLAVTGEAPAEIESVLAVLLPHLQVVRNNSPESPAGGGTPRQLPAPPLDA